MEGKGGEREGRGREGEVEGRGRWMGEGGGREREVVFLATDCDYEAL